MRVAAPFIALSLTALAACDPYPEYQTAPTNAMMPVCDASQFAHMIGAPISDVQLVNPGVQVRVLPADSFVPRDFDANRLTFTTTPDDKIGRVFCG
jgi:hypothetical protein